MASRPRAADDFTTIKTRIGELQRAQTAAQNSTTPAVVPSSSGGFGASSQQKAQSPERQRIADDFDGIRGRLAEFRKQREESLKDKKDKPAGLDASAAWPGPPQFTRMGGSPVATRGVTLG